MCGKAIRLGILPLMVLAVLASSVWGVDLTVQSVDISGLSYDCQAPSAVGTVGAEIKNVGTLGTTVAFTVLFFEDLNDNGTYESAIDNPLGSETVANPLASDEVITVSTPVNSGVTFAWNLVYVFADSDNDIAETDETNNILDSGEGCEFRPAPGSFSLVEEWNWNSSTVYSSHVQVMMTPVVVNITDDNGDSQINDDDVPDVVFSCFTGGAYSSNGVLRAVSGDDGSEIFTTGLSSDLDVLGEGSIAVGDIDGDGLPEIIANEDISETHSINSYGRLIVFEHDGAFKFKSYLMSDGRLRWGGAALADLNADGTPEIIVGRHILDNTGSLVAMGSSRRGDNGVGPLSTVADIDRDGKPDIVAGLTVYEVLLDGSNNIVGMDVKWEARNAAGNEVSGDGFPAVANLDADDRAEVVVVSNGYVWAFDDDGSHIWGPVSIPGGGRGGPPNCDDFDNDGAVEVGTAGQARYAVYDTDGTLLWSSPTFDTSSNVTGSSVFDFEGDGSAEVVYKDQTYLRIYRGTDGFILASIATGSGTTYENPVIADVDRDGNAEIIICANNYTYGTRRGIQVFGDANDSWVNTRRIWNQHTYHITNVNDDATIPVHEDDNWLTFNSFRSQKAGSGVYDAPDITASYIRVDNSYCPDAVGLTARIGNGGAIVGASPIDVAFFDGDPGAGGVLLGVAQTTKDLGPGQFEDVTLEVSPPLAGLHTIFVAADDDGAGSQAINECIESNNYCSAELSDFCVLEMRAAVDIKPTSCPNPLNTKSNGVLPIAILGTDGFDLYDDLDVYDVDPWTVTLEGVSPLRWAYEDVATPFEGDLCDCTSEGPDGLMDMTFKFDRQEIVAALLAVTDGEYRPLTLMGETYDGTPIEGQDCVWIKHKGKDPAPPAVISVETFTGSATTVHLNLSEATDVSMMIYDVRGKQVRTVVNGVLPGGDHSIPWNGRDDSGHEAANGVYFCRVKAGTVQETVKMLRMQ